MKSRFVFNLSQDTYSQKPQKTIKRKPLPE